MSKIIKFSKSYNDIIKIKTDFFSQNEFLRKHNVKINKFYSKQKKRKKCKNCEAPIEKKPFMRSNGVNYTWCFKCNHLNGLNEDSEKFLKYLYQSDSGSNYSLNYKKNFFLRVKKIYNPKVQFLKSVIRKKFDVLDIGCGAGHLLKACENENIVAEGYDPNYELVNLGKKFLKTSSIKHVSLKYWHKEVLNSKRKALCLMGVLEHLQDPNLMIKTFKKSNIEYLYIQVPLFSFTCMLENIVPKVFPRILSGGHTHLYTKDSLYFLAKKHNLKIIGEWWFGADIADLYRSIKVLSNNKSKTYDFLLNKYLYSSLDELQNVLDKKMLCSQVHMVFKKD